MIFMKTYKGKIQINQEYLEIIGGSGSGKTNLLFNLINPQPDID